MGVLSGNLQDGGYSVYWFNDASPVKMVVVTQFDLCIQRKHEVLWHTTHRAFGGASLKLGLVILIKEHHFGRTDKPQELLEGDYLHVQNMSVAETVVQIKPGEP